jgi:vacuolar-type H+-ATPase subunit H
MTEPIEDVGQEVGRLMKTSQVAAEEMIRTAEQQAAAIVAQARREAADIRREANVYTRETVELLLLTAQAQREEMLDEKAKQDKLIRDADKELRDQITMLRNTLTRMDDEAQRETTASASSTNGSSPAETIWTDSEITNKGPRPVPFAEPGTSGT